MNENGEKRMEKKSNYVKQEYFKDLVAPHLKPKSTLSLRDRWFLCKYLTWDKESEDEHWDHTNLVELLLRIMEEGHTKKDVVESYEEHHGGLDSILSYWVEKLQVDSKGGVNII
ncbi:MAG: hypothetical protein HWN80_08580 [Candidatus Lokiarchaeota archaeon]|nr:hypothetical protein [Candidatus Lokiarchaeota archaeon]